MSKNLEESPMSDNKMDISDTTNSQESTEVSPAEEITKIINEETTINPKHLLKDAEVNEFSMINGAQTYQLLSEDNEYINEYSVEKENNSLDLNNKCQRNPSSKIIFIDQELLKKNRTNLTLTNSHPLMSPVGTDSDSENSYKFHKRENKISFPDVIPRSDQQQFLKPHLLQPKRLNSNTQEKLIMTKNTINNKRRIHYKTKCGESSPEIVSSDSEPDISQYQATVEANYQSVALISNIQSVQNPGNRSVDERTATRKNFNFPNRDVAISDDMSSLDSISNHSFDVDDDDDDIEHNLASLSPSSSFIEGLDNEKDHDDMRNDEMSDIETPTNLKSSERLPVYSVEEERRDSRSWQKITLPDGRTREIDMKVIEPYKRVLSHGGYLQAGGHNAIVIFCACHLPDRSRADYHYVMDNLFFYVVKTLEQLITEDYVLVYLHGGSSRRNIPPFPWLKKCYQLLDRRLRKSLKNLYLVHPTFWIKSIVWMARPFVSSKFWRKMEYVRSLEELNTLISVEKAAIPEKVKLYDSKYN